MDAVSCTNGSLEVSEERLDVSFEDRAQLDESLGSPTPKGDMLAKCFFHDLKILDAISLHIPAG